MATLTTQSIGAASAQLLNQAPAAVQRLTEAAQAAGVNQTQNLARAQNSAVSAQKDQDRSVQLQKRAEGSFSGQRDDSENKQDSGESTEARTPPSSSGRLNRTA